MVRIPQRRPAEIPGRGVHAEDRVLQYLFNDGPGATEVEDASSSGLNGSFNGAVPWVSGPAGFGLHFPGTGPHIEACAAGQAASPDVLSLTDLTLEFVGTHDDASANWGWVFGEAANGAFLFGKEGGTGNLHVYLEGMLTGTTFSGSFNVADGKVHHCLVTHDKAGQVTHVYVDGQNVGDAADNTSNVNFGAGLRIGTRQDSFPEYWLGKLYVVTAYRALFSGEEVERRFEELTPYVV